MDTRRLAIDALVEQDIVAGRLTVDWAEEVVERVAEAFEDGLFSESEDSFDTAIFEIAELSVPYATADITALFADSIDLVMWEGELDHENQPLINQMSSILYEVAINLAWYARRHLEEQLALDNS